MMKTKITEKVLITGLICISVIELYALSKGVNGVLLTGVIGVIAGLLGWTRPQLKIKK